MHHRTVSGAPGWINSNSSPLGFWKSHSAIIHRTVRCSTGLSGVPAEQRLQRNGRLQRKPKKRYSARIVHAESEQAPEGALDSEQWLSGGPGCQSSNGRTLTVGWHGWRTGLSGAPIDSSPTPMVGLVVGAINTPNHHHFKVSKFSAIAFNTRALDFTPRHNQEIKSSPKSKITPTT
jgi:hypothetical protein